MKCLIIRTSHMSFDLSPDFAKRWYLSEILRLDFFQHERPCFQDNFDKIDIKLIEGNNNDNSNETT